MRGPCIALALWALAGSDVHAQALAQFGSGEAERYTDGEFQDVLDAARAPLISDLGDDALRFSSQPALGGVGYIITLRANGRVNVRWFYGHPSLGWRRTRQISFRVPEAEYQRIATQVDRLVAEGVAELGARARASSDAIVVCSDGPGYRTERIRNGEAQWFSPLCSGQNREVAQLLTSWAFVRLGD